MSVVVIDDQVSYVDAFGLALSLTPDFELVGRAGDAETGIEVCLRTRPDLVVTDYRLPGGIAGTHLAATLREKGFDAPILVLTGFMAPQVVREAEEIENLHAMSKDTPMTSIVSAMRQVKSGGALDPDEETSPPKMLSPGELEVLEMLANGNTPTEIANIMHLSLHTVRARIKGMHKKLNVASQGEAIATAIRLGLVVPPK